LEADLEALQLARECLRVAEVHGTTVDLADVRIVRSLLAGVPINSQLLNALHAALAAKDVTELGALTRNFPKDSREGLLALPRLATMAS
jgi:ATP phosphoribosyltransferase regulatory subunit